jgi:hypothetical protein
MASSNHSTWQVLLVPYNMPPWLCMKQSNFIMSMLILGTKGTRNDIDVYLETLVDELMQLWEGVDTYDAVTKEKSILHAALLWIMPIWLAMAPAENLDVQTMLSTHHKDG